MSYLLLYNPTKNIICHQKDGIFLAAPLKCCRKGNSYWTLEYKDWYDFEIKEYQQIWELKEMIRISLMLLDDYTMHELIHADL